MRYIGVVLRVVKFDQQIGHGNSWAYNDNLAFNNICLLLSWKSGSIDSTGNVDGEVVFLDAVKGHRRQTMRAKSLEMVPTSISRY